MGSSALPVGRYRGRVTETTGVANYWRDPRRTHMALIIAKAEWDDEAKVWVAHVPEIPGINTEAESLPELARRLPPLIEDFLDAEADIEGMAPGSSPPTVFTLHIVAHVEAKISVPRLPAKREELVA